MPENRRHKFKVHVINFIQESRVGLGPSQARLEWNSIVRKVSKTRCHTFLISGSPVITIVTPLEKSAYLIRRLLVSMNYLHKSLVSMNSLIGHVILLSACTARGVTCLHILIQKLAMSLEGSTQSILVNAS